MLSYKLSLDKYNELARAIFYKDAIAELKENVVDKIPEPNQVALREFTRLQLKYVGQFKKIYTKYQNEGLKELLFDTSKPWKSYLYNNDNTMRFYYKGEVQDVDRFTIEDTVVTKITKDIFNRTCRSSIRHHVSNVILKRIMDNSLTLSNEKIAHFVNDAVDTVAERMYSTYRLREDYGQIFNSKECVITHIDVDVFYGTAIFTIQHSKDFDLQAALRLSGSFEWQDPNGKKISYLQHYFKFQDIMVNAYTEDYEILPSGYLNTDAMPLTISMMTTTACNLRCTYCYQVNHGNKYMTKETAKKAIDYFLEAALSEDSDQYVNIKNNPSAIIEFVGGDGLMNPEIIDFSMLYMLQKMIDMDHPWLYKFSAFVSTNGVLYRNKRCQEIIKRWHGILGVTVTVDGNQELHNKCRVFPDGSGSYKYAADCFDDLLKNGYCPMSKLTLSPDNLDYLVPSIIDFINRGHIHIWFNCINEHEWTDAEANRYFHYLCEIVEYLYDNDLITRIDVGVFGQGRFRARVPGVDESNYCGGDGHMLEIDPDGNFFNCSRFQEVSLAGKQPPLCIGSVDRGIGATESDRASIKEMRSISRRSQSTDECYYCPVATNCGYCTAYNYELYGTCNKRTTTSCKMHKANALANYLYIKRLATKIINVEPEQIPLTYDLVKSFISEQEYNDLLNS